jgi:hypothetical protein
MLNSKRKGDYFLDIRDYKKKNSPNSNKQMDYQAQRISPKHKEEGIFICKKKK